LAVARAVVAVALLVLGGCANVEDRPGAAATAARSAATAVPTRAAFTVGVVSTPTRAPTPARTPTPQPRDEADVEQSVANARAMVEKALASPTLPAIEDLLLETVALAAPTGGDQLTRATAARWLRQRATDRIQLIQFERHQHQALINANTRGWSAIAPLTSSQLAFTLRQYDAAGAQDPDEGQWLIDVLESE
jgi:hypothetical protein